MQAQTTARPEGKPALPAVALHSRRDGMVRQSLDWRPEMLQAIERAASTHPTGTLSRADMTRILVGEALDARGIDWAAEVVPGTRWKRGVTKKKKGGQKKKQREA